MLTVEMLQFLLEELSWDTIHMETKDFPYRIQKRGYGYKDGLAGSIQAGLSMMLELEAGRVARRGA